MPNVGMLDAGIIQTPRTINITMPTPQETLQATPTALPTTEPGTSQISYTIQQSDLPILDGGATCKYTATLVAGGKNIDAAGQTVSYRVLKNASSVATATSGSVTANNFWTHIHCRFYDVTVGDVLECRLWASSVNVNYDYYALFIYPTRNIITTSNNVLTNLTYTQTTWPTLTLGTPFINSSYNTQAYMGDVPLGNMLINTYNVMFLRSTYGIGRVYFGDGSISSTLNTHTTKRPSYNINNIPTKIVFTPTSIRIT